MACSRGEFRPNSAEMLEGKRLSCTCGMDGLAIGCEQQPGTALLMDVKGDLSSPEGGTVSIVEVGGTPNAWDASSQPYPTPLPERFRYAFPQVWGGELTGCRWHDSADVEECSAADPSLPIWEGSMCHWMECSGSDIQCPPADVQQCPGYNGTNDFPCGFVPETGPNWVSYWTHKCYPISTPTAGAQISLKCRVTEDDDNFECIFWHEGMTIPPFIPFTCQVGNCVYGDPVFPEPPHAPPKHKYNLAQTKVVFIIFCVVSMTLFFAHVLIDRWQLYQGRIQYQKALARMESVDNLAGPVSPTRAHAAGATLQKIPLSVKRADGHSRLAALSWSDISCTVTGLGRSISVLEGIFGRVMAPIGATSGVCALLGPSGAGKTTLLNILAGRANAGRITGVVALDGRPMRPSERRAAAGYISQEDVLPGTSTVWEHLVFHASLRLPLRTTREERHSRAWEVLAMLGLAKVASSLIGDEFTRGISGGEKRRVSIASELLVHPQVLFLDEPTTGLDSSNAASVVDILANLAATGTVVVMSIHQPTVGMLRAMDSLVLLSLHGRMVYSGPMAESVGHFEALGYVPAKGSSMIDHMLDVLIHAGADESADLVGAFQYGGEQLLEGVENSEERYSGKWEAGNKGSHVGIGVQLRVLSWRAFKNMCRHPYLFLTNFGISLAVALLMGIAFQDTGYDTWGIQNRLGSIFFILLFLAFMSLSSLPIWREQWCLYRAERASGLYSTTAYFFSTLFFDFVPLRIMPAFFFGLVAYPMIGLHDRCDNCITVFVGVLVLSNIAATSTSMLIGLMSPNNSAANAVGTLVIMLFAVFGGVYLNKDRIPGYCQWVADISYFNHAYELLIVNEFYHQSPLPDGMFEFVVPRLNMSVPTDGYGILAEFSFLPVLQSKDEIVRHVRSQNSRDAFWVVSFAATILTLTYALLWFLESDAKHAFDQSVARALGGVLRFRNPGPKNGGTEPESDACSSKPLSKGSELDEPLLDSGGEVAIEAAASKFSCADITVSHKSLTADTSDRIIHGISADVRGGSVCALMGPSGAGKTTLLNVLSGRAVGRPVLGSVKLDGKALSPSERRAVAGYVAQEDVLPGTSTVWEHLVFHASLRLPLRTTREERHSRAWEVLAMLGLAKVASSLIGDEFTRGISGGEKRRVSIASELLVHPQVLFLDEPTTGLDSSNAASVVDILANLAATGTVVVMSIHQPTVGMLRAMDSLVLLSLHGRMVYSGPMAESVGHFEALGYVPAKGSSMIDHMLDVLIHAGADESADLVGAFQYGGEQLTEGKEVGPLGAGGQNTGTRRSFTLAKFKKELFAVALLLGRSGRKTCRNPLVIFLTFLASGLVSAGIGLIFRGVGRDTNGIQNRFGCLFFILWYLSMMTVGSLPVWHDDCQVFMRERASRVYSTTSHFIAVVLYDVIILRLIPPMFFGVVYSFIGLHEGHSGRFIVTLVLANVAATVMTLMIGLVSSKVSTANVAGTVVMLLNSLFGGYFLSVRRLSPALNLIAKIFPGHHAYGMLVANEFHATTGWRFTGEVNGREVGVDVTGEDILDTFGFSSSSWDAGLRALLLIIAICLAITHVLLKHRWTSEQ